MKNLTKKIRNIEEIQGEITSIEESKECKQCDRIDAVLSVTFKETNYDKQQKTIYFKQA